MNSVFGHTGYNSNVAGKAFIYGKSDSDEQIRKLYAASERTMRILKELYGFASVQAGHNEALIFEAQIEMLKEIRQYAGNKIKSDKLMAEKAVEAVREELCEMFRNNPNPNLRSRSADINDICDTVAGNLREDSAIPDCYDNVILIAEEFSPSDIMKFKRKNIAGLISINEDSNSHACILSEAMGIPSITGVSSDIWKYINNGDTVLMIPEEKRVIIDPDDKVIDIYMNGRKENFEYDPADYPEDIKFNAADIYEARRFYGTDIGLFRSEFMYLGRIEAPTEDELYNTYKEILAINPERSVTVRTADLGGDKTPDYVHLKDGDDSALGIRGIRFSLSHPAMFVTEIRALLRASRHGRLKVMFPMVNSVEELEKVFSIIEAVKSEFAFKGINVPSNIKWGVMIETPAAALISHRLAPMVDFMSIGTNDLMQYVMACDRHSLDLATMDKEPLMRLIEECVASAAEYDVELGVCGELASDPGFAEMLRQSGVDYLSVNTASLPVFAVKADESSSADIVG
ncbi:MAG: phosphoenolpyruvate--protein phosphotransferase [Clostridiales bacterium]|nr:phosphoenolpyruvate--protein phosphotransferase [Clostridiales bacterium]